jgi:hypothetical protein
MAHKVHDNLFKVVFGDHTLFAQFLRDFIPIDLFSNVQPEDIEDIDPRYLPTDRENRDSDTVKRINLTGYPPIFVIAITEHESKVNYRSPFKMLLYITLALEAYEKQCDKQWKAAHPKSKAKGVSHTKDFKYVPVLPIVFHDGPGAWTAERNFLNKTELSALFEKYIPSFEYIVVTLNDVTREQLLTLRDPLSLVLLADKVKGPEELALLTQLPEEYLTELEKNFPSHLKRLVANVVEGLLRHEGIDNAAIGEITNQIEKRRSTDMFDDIEKDWCNDLRSWIKAEKEIRSIKRGISMRERQIAILEEGIAAREQHNSDMEQEIAMRKRQITVRKREKSVLEREIAVLDKEKSVLERENSVIARELAMLDQEDSVLEQEKCQEA